MTDAKVEMLGEGGPLQVEAVDDAGARALLMGFESIGENCEFGLLQRRYGAEPLGLLRWSFVHPNALIRLLDTDFEGYGDIDKILYSVAPWGEIILRDSRYGMNRHTYLQAEGSDIEAVVTAESRRIRFLVGKFLTDLKVSDKVFVYKSNELVSVDAFKDIHRALRRHGPATLLGIVPPDAVWPAESVDQCSDALLIGRIDGLGPAQAGWNIPFSSWLKVCGEAWRRSDDASK